MIISDKQYKTIYADPPWDERGGGQIKRGADRHYPLMHSSQIKAMPVRDLIHPAGCHLYLWVTNNFLDTGIDVMKAWGFRYVTTITWFKEGNIGLGQYFRGVTEHCLFGVYGRLPMKLESGKRMQGITGFRAPKREHSRKPEEMRKMIEKVSYGPRIELFAREESPGWDIWGNETDKFSQVSL